MSIKDEFKKEPMRRILKTYSDNCIVTADAVDMFRDAMAEYAKELSKDAYSICKHAGRKTIKREDIEFALEY